MKIENKKELIVKNFIIFFMSIIIAGLFVFTTSKIIESSNFKKSISAGIEKQNDLKITNSKFLKLMHSVKMEQEDKIEVLKLHKQYGEDSRTRRNRLVELIVLQEDILKTNVLFLVLGVSFLFIVFCYIITIEIRKVLLKYFNEGGITQLFE